MIIDLQTPDEDILSWVEDRQTAPIQPQKPELEPKDEMPDPYRVLAAIFDAIRPFEQAYDAANEALRRWRAEWFPSPQRA